MTTNKTIGITLRLWTNDLKAEVKDRKWTQACWDSGVIMIEANKEKGIKSANPTPVNCFEDIVPAIRQLCRKNKILIVSDGSKPRINRATPRTN